MLYSIQYFNFVEIRLNAHLNVCNNFLNYYFGDFVKILILHHDLFYTQKLDRRTFNVNNSN